MASADFDVANAKITAVETTAIMPYDDTISA